MRRVFPNVSAQSRRATARTYNGIAELDVKLVDAATIIVDSSLKAYGRIFDPNTCVE
jgi:hypothetical protein